MKKNKGAKNIVYSTNPDFQYQWDNEEESDLEPSEQQLLVRPDRKQRKGKTVTLITGFRGSSESLKSLEKQLKSVCGVGGSAKNGEIILQGDLVKKVAQWLEKEGYRVKISGI